MSDYDDICLEIIATKVPLIDVRAPGEYTAGAIPHAVNLPLMTDEERHLVGRCYKEKGREEALDLGYQLINGKKKSDRLQAWRSYIAGHPDTYLYCSRGGLRSKIAQQWIKEDTGQVVGKLAGGYKAFRSVLLRQLDPAALCSKPTILGGRTGSGKTMLLQKIDNAIDLEAIAHHRGSSFGQHVSPQPSQADFENRLACAMITHGRKGFSSLILEDEGRHIGKRFLPKSLSSYFSSCPLVLLETSFEQRIQIIYDEYVIHLQEQYISSFGSKNGLQLWLKEMGSGADRIKKRLGAQRHQQLIQLQKQACQHQLQTDDGQNHKSWIRLLLGEYYDPMYDYQLKKRSELIVFRGDFSAVTEYLVGLESHSDGRH